MTSLRDALDQFTAGWHDDLSPSWRTLLAGSRPDHAAAHYPSRRQLPQAGTWGPRATEVALPHPVAPGFVGGPHPFGVVNEKLAAFGAPPIRW